MGDTEVLAQRRREAAEIAVEFLEEREDPQSKHMLNVVKNMMTDEGKCRVALRFLDQRTDADGTETGFDPNPEMVCMINMEAALAGKGGR